MAEKEERILIDILPPASGFGSCGGFYTEGVGEYFCCWNGEKEPITEAICNNCPHDKSMTRHEALCRISRAICRAGGNECIGDCESCDAGKIGPFFT
jgi:hypothetical protein